MEFSVVQVPGIQEARRYAHVSSTMDVARLLIVERATSPCWSGLVLAERQQAGRGRQGRVWRSTGGAFLATYVFSVEQGPTALSGYSLACGVAICRALNRLQAPVRLKWPNDLVVADGGALKKLGGILIEVEAVKGFHCVLIGIGINLASAPSEFGDHATSVSQIRGASTEPEDILSPLSSELSSMHRTFIESGGFKAFMEEWQELSCLRPGISLVGIDGGSGEVSGVYHGVEQSGALVLAVANKRREFLSGHVTSLTL